MSLEKYALADAKVEALVAPVRDRFLAHAPEYDSIERQSADLVAKEPKAFHVAGAGFVVEAALSIVTDPDYQATLPREVLTRQAIASLYAKYIAHQVETIKALDDFYSTSLHLESDPRRMIEILEPGYLSSLGEAPFFDVRWIGGGALKFIQETGIDEKPAALIGRSKEIIRPVSKLDKGKARLAHNELGLMPKIGILREE